MESRAEALSQVAPAIRDRQYERHMRLGRGRVSVRRGGTPGESTSDGV